MENVVLVIHLLLALALIGIVLLQRSEGGGLGIGGGVMSGRAAATALGKMTWALAVAFIATSIALTVIAAQNSASQSVLDRLGVPASGGEDFREVPDAGDLLPPRSDTAPLTPPRAD
ncbi:MAG: preprotein translocase subunit SecG [Pseudomonadota bacterium]